MNQFPPSPWVYPVPFKIFSKIRGGAWGKMIHEKNLSKKSRDTVPLREMFFLMFSWWRWCPWRGRRWRTSCCWRPRPPAHRVPPVLHLLDELLVEAEGVVLVLHHQRLQHEPQRLPYQLQVLHIYDEKKKRCSECLGQGLRLPEIRDCF